MEVRCTQTQAVLAPVCSTVLEQQTGAPTWAEMARQVVDASLDLLEQVWYVFIIKGQAATQQSVQYHTTAPHVNLRASIQLATDHLQQTDHVSGCQ